MLWSLRGFHYDKTNYTLRTGKPVQEANGIMEDSTRGLNEAKTFNDLPKYLELLNDPSYTKVEMKQVIVKMNSYILGMKAIYRCMLVDGTSIEIEGTLHSFETGKWYQDGGKPYIQVLNLKQDEYLVDIITRQGEILDGLCFVTNRRQEYFGGFGGYDRNDDRGVKTNPNITVRIVAFAGTSNGVMHRLGFYKEYGNWDIIKPFVILRALFQQKRAKPQDMDRETVQEKIIAEKAEAFLRILVSGPEDKTPGLLIIPLKILRFFISPCI